MRRRPRNLGPIAIIAMAGLLPGCGGGMISISDMGGMEVTVEGSTLGVDDRDGQMRFYNERTSLRVRDSHLYRDTTDLGPVQRGDQVRLARDGRVFVNGTERTGG